MDPIYEEKSDLLQVVRRHWLIVVAAVVLAAAAAYGVSPLQSTKYSASPSLVFGSEGPADSLLRRSSPSSQDTAQRRAATIVQRGGGHDVAARAAKTLNRSTDSVAGAIHVENKGVSNIVQVTATAGSARGAAKLANTYANSYVALRGQSDAKQAKQARAAIERQLQTLTPAQRNGPEGRQLRRRADELALLTPLASSPIQVAERAPPPSSASSPNVKMNVALGALIGLL